MNYPVPSISDKRARVFVTQEQPFNYAPAEVFGDIVFCTKDEFGSIAGSLINKALVNEVRGRIAHFDPNRDFLLFSGSPSVLTLVGMLLGQRKIDNVRFLKWNPRSADYRVIDICLSPLAQEEHAGE